MKRNWVRLCEALIVSVMSATTAFVLIYFYHDCKPIGAANISRPLQVCWNAIFVIFKLSEVQIKQLDICLACLGNESVNVSVRFKDTKGQPKIQGFLVGGTALATVILFTYVTAILRLQNIEEKLLCFLKPR